MKIGRFPPAEPSRVSRDSSPGVRSFSKVAESNRRLSSGSISVAKRIARVFDFFIWLAFERMGMTRKNYTRSEERQTKSRKAIMKWRARSRARDGESVCIVYDSYAGYYFVM